MAMARARCVYNTCDAEIGLYDRLEKFDQPQYAQYGAYYFFANLFDVKDIVSPEEGKDGMVHQVLSLLLLPFCTLID